MSKDPAVLFYTSDFLTGTLLMSYEQRGKYITLLCLQHQTGRISKKKMSQICNNNDQDIYDKFIQDENGSFYNNRMEEEQIKRKNYSKSRINNRLGKTKRNKHKKNISKTYVPHMENENEDEDKDINKRKYKKNLEDMFNAFYSKYPKHKGRQKAYEKYIQVRKNISHEIIIQGVENLNKAIKDGTQDFKYVQNPATWLNQGGWDDEYKGETKEDEKWKKDRVQLG